MIIVGPETQYCGFLLLKSNKRIQFTKASCQNLQSYCLWPWQSVLSHRL